MQVKALGIFGKGREERRDSTGEGVNDVLEPAGTDGSRRGGVCSSLRVEDDVEYSEL